MPINHHPDKKNILDFQFFKLRKKAELQEVILKNNENNSIPPLWAPKSIEELEYSKRVKNIKESVQRINNLISELKQISTNPNK